MRRLLPLLLVAGGLAGVGRVAPRMTEDILNTVRAVLVRAELAETAAALERDAGLGMSIPTPGDAAALQAWLRANVKARQDRDPSLDLWEHPYLLVATQAEPRLVSFGPDGARGDCRNNDTPDADDLCETVRLPRVAEVPFRALQP